MATLTVERVPCASLTFYPHNPRLHDVAMIAESLRENGLYRPLVVQTSTRFVLAGNGTLEAALSLGWTEIDAVFIDCADIRARKIVLADNKTADAGSYSADDLANLLLSLDDLSGTGYSASDLARLGGELPAGFAELDPDAPPPEPALITCPRCSYSIPVVSGGQLPVGRHAHRYVQRRDGGRCHRLRHISLKSPGSAPKSGAGGLPWSRRADVLRSPRPVRDRRVWPGPGKHTHPGPFGINKSGRR